MKTALRFTCLALAMMGGAAGGAIVTVEVEAKSDSTFIYNLKVKNLTKDCDLCGLLILKGDTVFGLNAASDITAPDGWSSIGPVPFVTDDLSYSSGDLKKDIQPGATLEGFSFRSFTNPADLKPGDFAVEVICRTDGRQISAGNAVLVPEPGSNVLGALGLATLAALTARRRWAPKSDGHRS